jgi:hypothetical protein
MAAKIPVKIGHWWRGTEWARMMRDPEKVPEHPSPAISRPSMRIDELGAAPHIADPISNKAGWSV